MSSQVATPTSTARPGWGVYVKTLLTVILWGASFVATKVALRDAQPVTIVWVRFGIGVLVLGAAVIGRRQFRLPAGKDLLYFALVGAVGITFHQWLQSTGLLTAQATTSAWIVSTSPVFMAILGWIFFKEALRLRQVMGILMAAVGVLLVVSGGDFEALALGQFGTPGDLLMVISAVNWAVFAALSRYGLQRYPAALMMLFVMLFGWLFTTVMFVTGPGVADLASLSREGWGAVLFLAVFCTGLAYIFWYDALQVLPSAQAGAFLYIEPLVTAIIASFTLDEPLLAATLIGGAIILLGVWQVNRQS